ncbi:site-specific integrase [Luteibacter aegosomatissinici]|uniref:site-specific integrase n=1 Tax=Luteibacter aegosomatissinici TaxID=2911539 RepID=UPI001FF9FC7A|nr:site-specific integrase [Luteibacter aegosomatissinici]UPG92836.1 site-specific integrase [Luteibacter aegosomatissinici]
MTQQRRGSLRVPGGRNVIADSRTTLDAPLHPIAQAVEDSLLASTNAKAKTRRRVVVINEGVKIPFQTTKTDAEIEAHFAPKDDTGDDTDDNTPPGHANRGENPFESAVSRAVAAQLALLGVTLPRVSPITAPQPMKALHGYPAARRTNQHLKLATEIDWGEPQDGNALLSTRIGRYMRHIHSKELTYAYVKEHESAFRILTEVLGDKATGEVSVTDMDEVLDAIAGLPKHYSKVEEFRDLSIPQIVWKARQLNVGPRMLNSQQRLVTVLRTFFIWLETRGEVRPGLLLGVRLFHQGKDFGGQRDWFDPAEIRLMFDVKKEAAFFVPWQTWGLRLALFAGMRQLEIAQLRVDDIQNVEGIWCIDISPDKSTGKRVKNQASRRKIPIHDRLINAGFLDYVNQARAAGVQRLFPDLKPGKQSCSKKMSCWFSVFIRKHCGIESKAKTFHSLRHTFATLADRSEIRDEHIMKLLGHDWGKSILRRTYTQELDLREKHHQLHRIQFPDVKMTPHAPSRYERYFRIAYADQTRQTRLDAVFGHSPRKRAR